jgi:hypothetical protein
MNELGRFLTEIVKPISVKNIGRMSILQKSYSKKQHPIDLPFDQVL